MAKYRLLSAHYLEIQDGTQSVWLPGDAEMMFDKNGGETAGTVVGDGTPYRVRWPTLEMAALDPESEMMLEKERERLRINDAGMNPVDMLPIGDTFEQRYIPGFNTQRGPGLPDGAPVVRVKK